MHQPKWVETDKTDTSKNRNIIWHILQVVSDASVPEADKEMEFILVVNGTSFAAIGWRPASINKSCKSLPAVEEYATVSRKTRAARGRPHKPNPTLLEPLHMPERIQAEPEPSMNSKRSSKNKEVLQIATTTPKPTVKPDNIVTPAPEPEPSAEPEAQPEPEAESKPEPEGTSEPQVEPETSSEPKPEPEVVGKPEPISEPKPEAESEPSAEPEGAASVSEPEATSEPKTEPEVSSEPEST